MGEPQGIQVDKNADAYKTRLSENMDILGAKRLNQGITPNLKHLFHEADDLTQEQIESSIDSLTGFLNRKGFEKNLRKEAKRSKRTGRPLSMVFLDLNGLKLINDTEGHKKGDELIKKAIDIIAEGREYDRAARWGGDEFAKLLPETHEEEAIKYWERINQQFENKGISIVAGIVQIDPSSESTIQESWRLCDLAEKEAKIRSKANNEINLALTPNDLTSDQILAA